MKDVGKEEICLSTVLSEKFRMTACYHGVAIEDLLILSMLMNHQKESDHCVVASCGCSK